MPTIDSTAAISQLQRSARAQNSPTKRLYHGKGYQHLVPGTLKKVQIDGVEHFEADFSNRAVKASTLQRVGSGAAAALGGVLTLGTIHLSKDFRRHTFNVAKDGQATQRIVWPVNDNPPTPAEKGLEYNPKDSNSIKEFVEQDHIRRQIREYLGMQYYIDWTDGSALIRDTKGTWRSWSIFEEDGSVPSRGEMVKAIRVFIAQYDDMVKDAKEKGTSIDSNFTVFIRSKYNVTIICNNNLIKDPNYRETIFSLYHLGRKVKWSDQAKKNVEEIFKIKDEDPKPFESPLSSQPKEAEAQVNPPSSPPASSRQSLDSSRVEVLDDDNVDG